MQTMGLLSLKFCVASTTLPFFEQQIEGQITFGVSVIMESLGLPLVEIQISGAALALQLLDVKCREL